MPVSHYTYHEFLAWPNKPLVRQIQSILQAYNMFSQASLIRPLHTTPPRCWQILLGELPQCYVCKSTDTTVTLHPKSIQGIIYFSRNRGIKIFQLLYSGEQEIEWHGQYGISKNKDPGLLFVYFRHRSGLGLLGPSGYQLYFVPKEGIGFSPPATYPYEIMRHGRNKCNLKPIPHVYVVDYYTSVAHATSSTMNLQTNNKELKILPRTHQYRQTQTLTQRIYIKRGTRQKIDRHIRVTRQKIDRHIRLFLYTSPHTPPLLM